MSMNIEEMRQYVRHPVDIPIECTISDAPMQDKPSMRNLSQSGLCFTSSACATPGTNLHLKIPLAHVDIEVNAIVMWCNDMDDHYEIGVKFIDDKTEYSMRMVEQLCHIEEYRQQVKDTEGRALTSEEAGKEWADKFGSDLTD